MDAPPWPSELLARALAIAGERNVVDCRGEATSERTLHINGDAMAKKIATHGVQSMNYHVPSVVDGCACRKLNPGISVMQSAQDWATKNVPGAIDGARDRRIFLQR